jgi:signal transduction histidine kinase
MLHPGKWRIRTRLIVVFAGVVIPFLALGGIGLMAFRSVLKNLDAMYWEAQVISDLERSLDRLGSAAKAYEKQQGAKERAELETRVARLHGTFALLTTNSSRHTPEQRLLELTRIQMDKIEALSREIMASPRRTAHDMVPGRTELLFHVIETASNAIDEIQGFGLQKMREEMGDALATFRRAEALAIALLVVTMGSSIAVALVVGASLSRPIKAIAHASRRMAEGDLSQRVDVSAGGEFLETAQAFNTMAEQVQAAQRGLAAHVRAQDAFLAVLSHELRNPLAPIRLATQLIRLQPGLTPAIERATGTVERQVKHLTRLLDDLLDASRITRGQIELRKSSVDLASVVAGAFEASRELIEARKHAVSVSLPAEPIRLEGDPVRLEQIITNLLNNAAKYTPPEGHITLTGYREDRDVVVRVRDTGIGISPELAPRVFDLFTQGDHSLARSEGGLGIGLTVVRSLVKLHGGSVTVAPGSDGRGSEFVVRLPVGALSEPHPTPPPKKPPIPPRRILVIEDNPDTRETLQEALTLKGHCVDVAEDGFRGVELARSRRPEIVLVDIGLPGLTGYEVGKRLRAMLAREVVLIAVTGYGRPEDRRRTHEAGFDAHLVKPVSYEQIADVLLRESQPQGA